MNRKSYKIKISRVAAGYLLGGGVYEEFQITVGCGEANLTNAKSHWTPAAHHLNDSLTNVPTANGYLPFVLSNQPFNNNYHTGKHQFLPRVTVCQFPPTPLATVSPYLESLTSH